MEVWKEEKEASFPEQPPGLDGRKRLWVASLALGSSGSTAGSANAAPRERKTMKINVPTEIKARMEGSAWLASKSAAMSST